MRKSFKFLIAILIIGTIVSVAFTLFRPRFFEGEMTGMAAEGRLHTLTFDLEIRRRFNLQNRIYGYITLDGVRFVSVRTVGGRLSQEDPAGGFIGNVPSQWFVTVDFVNQFGHIVSDILETDVLHFWHRGSTWFPRFDYVAVAVRGEKWRSPNEYIHIYAPAENERQRDLVIFRMMND